MITRNRALLLISANAIGTGIYTTTGYALRDLQSPWWVLALWGLGGVYSLLGVYSYSLLHRFFPGSGGEYHFLSKGLHHYLGVIAGFVTIIMGFTVPLAAAAMACAAYGLRAISVEISQPVMAFVVMTFVCLIHWLSLRRGMRWHDGFVYLKLFLFLLLTVMAYVLADWRWVEIPSTFNIYIFAQSFFWVAYAYSGWNAIYYVVSEWVDSESGINRASYMGSSLVVVLYLLINIPLLFGVSTDKLSGVMEVVAAFFRESTGLSVERIIASFIALGLFSTMSSFVVIVPRIYSRMAEDKVLPSFFYFKAGEHPKHIILFQYFLTVMVLFLFRFEDLLKSAGFVLTSCSLLAVLSLYVTKYKNLKLMEWVGTASYVMLTSLLIYYGGPWFRG